MKEASRLGLVEGAGGVGTSEARAAATALAAPVPASADDVGNANIGTRASKGAACSSGAASSGLDRSTGSSDTKPKVVRKDHFGKCSCRYT